MSKIIAGNAIDGAAVWVARAEAKLDQAVAAKGESAAVGFPNTAYYLPIIYSFLGEKVETLGDARRVLRRAKELLPNRPSEKVWLPYLGNTLDAGAAALFACEIIEACKYLIGPNPVDGIWLGAASDVIMRERGIEFVDGTAPGFAAVTGRAPTNEIAAQIARELQEKNIYVFMGGATHGKQFAEQLAEAGVQLGWETRLVPFGKDVSALVYALGFASRAALSFGGVKPGDYKRNLAYNKNRIFAFVLAFDEVDAEKYAAAAGAINYGFPVIADTAIPQILPTGVCTYEHVVSSVPPETMVEKALEVRGCKIKITKVPVPVPYGAAFEGERIRKQDVQAEFGGNRTPAFEFVTSADLDQIVDGQIDLIGPDIDAVEPGSALPLGIWVQAAGRKMQPDFEPILERQIHHLLNGAEGIWHMGQRDILWTRVSRAGFAKGLRLRHYGEIIHAKLLADYPAIVDKVQVTLITDGAEVERRLAVARKVYDHRNRRLASMTDESVDTFYSCLLCQSFAPNHVCMITPERLGLCGAYNWLDGKAAFEIDPTGPNQPVKKGDCLDPVRGIWQGVNDYVYSNSHKTTESFCAYSIMDRPMTSCGCFEVICGYVPECNGVMIVNREFLGETPTGMTFSSLAGNVGGGLQTPGFMGCGKVFLTSRKFLFADGGHKRIVWMPKELKDLLADDLKERFAAAGAPDLLDKIADETIATEPAAIRAYLEKVGHPALTMDDMGSYAENADAATEEKKDAVTPGRRDAGTKDEGATPRGREGATGTVPFSGSLEKGTVPLVRAPGTKDDGQGAPLAVARNGLSPDDVAKLKSEILAQVTADLKPALTAQIVSEIINTLSAKFLGRPANGAASITPSPCNQGREGQGEGLTVVGASVPPSSGLDFPASRRPGVPASSSPPSGPPAAERIAGIRSFAIRKEKCETPICTVTLGATREQGGTRGRSVSIGGSSAMPFHRWEENGEGKANRPLVAMEVFDRVSEKYPAALRAVYGDLLNDPAAMAKACVADYGADLISVRLDGTHPERGNRSPDSAVELVGKVLQAVDVPLIVTGHNHYEKINEVLKAVAAAFKGENLLLNWVETENYRTVAGAALAYGHCVVAQTPIDVNMAKQLNILLTNMSVPQEKIVIDPMTAAAGYGVEYSYSVMERIRLTALGGDKMLAGPLILSPGFECAKIKELRASEKDFPAWGDLAKRAAMWELATATSFLHAGADVLVMYHPAAAMAIRRTIDRLMDKGN